MTYFLDRPRPRSRPRSFRKAFEDEDDGSVQICPCINDRVYLVAHPRARDDVRVEPNAGWLSLARKQEPMSEIGQNQPDGLQVQPAKLRDEDVNAREPC